MTREDQHAQLLQEIENQCDTLPLCQVPRDIVIGQGNLQSEVMVIGEAPGAEGAYPSLVDQGSFSTVHSKSVA